MADERNEELKEAKRPADGMSEEEATERLDKADVDMVAGGQGEEKVDDEDQDGPIELPEIL